MANPNFERAAVAIETLALGSWAGAMAGFAFAFAPAAFGAITDLGRFSALVERSIGSIAFGGDLCAAAALLAEGVRRLAGGAGRAIALRVALVLAAVVLTQVELRAVVPHMNAVAAQIPGGLNAVAPSDSRRAAYDALHARSSQIYGMAFLCVCAATAAAALGRSRQATL